MGDMDIEIKFDDDENDNIILDESQAQRDNNLDDIASIDDNISIERGRAINESIAINDNISDINSIQLNDNLSTGNDVTNIEMMSKEKSKVHFDDMSSVNTGSVGAGNIDMD